MNTPAKTFEDLVVWPKSPYGDTSQTAALLMEVSKLLEAHSQALFDPGNADVPVGSDDRKADEDVGARVPGMGVN